jgi:hypothetical protein
MKIISDTALQPFDHASNLRFESEHQRRIKCPGPLTFTDTKVKPKGTAPGGSTNNTPTPTRHPRDNNNNNNTNSGTYERPPPRDFTAFTDAGVTMPSNVANPPKTLLCVTDFMATAKIAHMNGSVPPKCTKPHTLKAGQRATTRLHMDELLTHYPKGYDRAAAKFQCCYYLNQAPSVAVKVMAALDKDTTHFK